jgi:outer membrane protein OmpU
MLVTAGHYAAADVSVSGDGRMGVVNAYDKDTKDNVTTFSNRMRIKFSGSGTTDSGLSFGGSFRANDAAGAKAGTSGSTFISGAFGKVTFGDVDSGDNAAVGQLASVGYTGLGSGNSINYAADAGGDKGLPGEMTDYSGARVLYTNTFGGVTLNLSSAQLTDGGASSYGIGGSYAVGALTVGVGYGTVDGGTVKGLKAYDDETGTAVTASAGDAGLAATTAGYFETRPIDTTVTDISASVVYVLGASTIKGIYQQSTVDGTADARLDAGSTAKDIVHGHAAIDLSSTATSMGLSVVHKINALSVTAYGISTEVSADTDLGDDATLSRYGVGVSYDLGGGASISGGWAGIDVQVPTAATGSTTDGALQKYTLATETRNQFDLGVSLSF